MITASSFHLRVYLFCSFCGCGVGAGERAGGGGWHFSTLCVFSFFVYLCMW